MGGFFLPVALVSVAPVKIRDVEGGCQQSLWFKKQKSRDFFVFVRLRKAQKYLLISHWQTCVYKTTDLTLAKGR